MDTNGLSWQLSISPLLNSLITLPPLPPPSVPFPLSMWSRSALRTTFLISEEGHRHLATLLHEDAAFCSEACNCPIKREEGGVSCGDITIKISSQDMRQSYIIWALAYAVYGVKFCRGHKKLGQLMFNAVCGFQTKEAVHVQKIKKML